MSKLSFLKLALVFVAALVAAGVGYMVLRIAGNEARVNQPQVGEPQEGKSVSEQILNTPTTAVVPKLPVIRLRYMGKVYDGVEGSYCWPIVGHSGVPETECIDKFLDPLDLQLSIPVKAGDDFTVELEAHEPPMALTALIFTSASESPEQITLVPNFIASFTIDLPPRVYGISIFGQWAEGDVSYLFKIMVGGVSSSR